jgi:oligopeptidase B
MVVKDLETGELLEDEITEMRGGAVWSPDDSSFLYTLLDENGRPWQVLRHVLGEPAEDDTVVYEEADAGFFVGVGIRLPRCTSSSPPATMRPLSTG